MCGRVLQVLDLFESQQGQVRGIPRLRTDRANRGHPRFVSRSVAVQSTFSRKIYWRSCRSQVNAGSFDCVRLATHFGQDDSQKQVLRFAQDDNVKRI